MTTGKTIALTIWIFVGKVMSLLFHMLSRFVIAFLPRRKHLLISWLQSLSTVMLEPKKIKSVTAPTFSSSVCYEVMGPDAMILVSLCWVEFLYVSFFMLSWLCFFILPFHPHQGALCFLPLEWYHLHIWGCWYFSWQSWFQLVIHPAQDFTWCTLHIS